MTTENHFHKFSLPAPHSRPLQPLPCSAPSQRSRSMSLAVGGGFTRQVSKQRCSGDLFQVTAFGHGSIMYLHLILLSLLAAAVMALPVAPAVSADCKVFYTGQCPGDESCLCTLNEPCSSTSSPCIRNGSTSNCGGACRKVAHNLCPGGTSCLADVGDCDAPPTYAWGPDVSDYQGGVDWAAVKAAGASFAFTKATEGLTFTCQTFAPNWQGMRDAGIGFRCLI